LESELPTKINLVDKDEVAKRNMKHVSRPAQLAPLLRKLMTEDRKSIQDRFILVSGSWIDKEGDEQDDSIHPPI
jgi:hypothetical protein